MSSQFLEYQARRIKPPFSGAERKAARKSNLLVIALCLLSAAVDFWFRRLDPFTTSEADLAELALFLICIGALIKIFASWLLRIRQYAESWKKRLLASVWILAPVLLAMFMQLINYYQIPFRLAFALSRSSLETEARRLKSDPALTFDAKMVGVLPIRAMKMSYGHIVVHVACDSDKTDVDLRLIWLPEESAPSDIDVVPLGNDWYHRNRPLVN